MLEQPYKSQQDKELCNPSDSEELCDKLEKAVTEKHKAKQRAQQVQNHIQNLEKRDKEK